MSWNDLVIPRNVVGVSHDPNEIELCPFLTDKISRA